MIFVGLIWRAALAQRVLSNASLQDNKINQVPKDSSQGSFHPWVR